MQEQNSLKKKTISGMFWSFSDLVFSQVIQFVIQIILARLLIPKDFGIIGMITVFIAVSQSFIDSGFTNALIREKNPSQEDYSTVFYFNLVMAILTYVILFFSAEVISRFFKEPQLIAILRVLALVLIISSFGLIQRTMLTKNINFKIQTKISVISSIVSGSIAIIFAYMGFGVWSLVIKTLVMQVIQSLLLCLYNRWMPSFVFSINSLMKFFEFGWKLLISGLINTLYSNLYFIIIGKVFSAVELGYYTNAQKLRDTASQSITTTVQKVGYPILSSIKEDEDRLRESYKKIIKTSVYITFPLMIGLASIGSPLIISVFGKRWTNSIEYFKLLCFSGILYPLHAINLNILQVKGRTDLFLGLEIFKKVIGLLAIAIALFFKLGIKGLIYVSIFVSFINYFLNSYYSAKLLNYSTWKQIKDITPASVASIIMGIIVYFSETVLPNNNLIKLIIQILLGIAVYISLSKIAKIEEFDTLYELISTISKKFKPLKTKKQSNDCNLKHKSIFRILKVEKFIEKIFIFIMVKKGYSPFFALKLVKDIFNDLFNNKQNKLKEKIWAYKRGFLSTKIKDYGLTEDNSKLFLTDFDYYKIYPINGVFKKWIDDKLTIKYILYPFREFLPKYYCHIKNGDKIISLEDGNSIKNVMDIVDLLKKEKKLSLKLANDSIGAGFYILTYIKNNFFINNVNVYDYELIAFLRKLENYLVAEYITVHSDIGKIYNLEANTLQVMVINTDEQHPIIANAIMRFGTGNTAVIDNVDGGGILSIVDVKSGRYYDAKRIKNNNVLKCEIHPDTNSKIEGYLPNWEFIKIKLIEISKYLYEVTYMGFDIAITHDGFKIIEINSHQSIYGYQCYYPLLVNNESEAFFKELLRNK